MSIPPDITFPSNNSPNLPQHSKGYEKSDRSNKTLQEIAIDNAKSAPTPQNVHRALIPNAPISQEKNEIIERQEAVLEEIRKLFGEVPSGNHVPFQNNNDVPVNDTIPISPGIDDKDLVLTTPSSQSSLPPVHDKTLPSSDRTRSDLVVYASQFVSGTMGATDEAFHMLGMFLEQGTRNSAVKHELHTAAIKHMLDHEDVSSRVFQNVLLTLFTPPDLEEKVRSAFSDPEIMDSPHLVRTRLESIFQEHSSILQQASHIVRTLLIDEKSRYLDPEWEKRRVSPEHLSQILYSLPGSLCVIKDQAQLQHAIQKIQDETLNDLDTFFVRASTKARSEAAKNFSDLLQSLPSHSSISGFTPEESQRYATLKDQVSDIENKYKTLQEAERNNAHTMTPEEKSVLHDFSVLEEKLSQSMNTSIAISKDQKQFLDGVKKGIHDLENQSYEIAQNAFRKFISLLKSFQVPDTTIRHIENKCASFLETIPSRMHELRAEMIHARKEWNPNKLSEFTYHVAPRATELTKEKKALVEVTSAYRAAGPAYSSTMPRNRTHDTTCVANFFHTISSPISQSDKELIPSCEATRSAIPVEFTQKDRTERALCTQKHIVQIIHAHAKKQVEKALENELDRDDILEGRQPVIVRQTLLTLLTPDIGRKLGGYAGIVDLADNERALLDETLDAINAIQGQNGSIEVPDPNNPEHTVKIQITYDILPFNVPSNKLNDSYRSSFIGKSLVYHSRAENMIAQSLQKLANQGKQRIQEINAQLENIVDNDFLQEEEKKELQGLHALLQEASHKRKELSKKIHKTGKLPDSKGIKAWQKASDVHAAKLQELMSQQEMSPAMKEYLKLIFEKSLLDDLIEDTQNLHATGIHKGSNAHSQLRFAFSSRIILLSSLLGYGTHFCCRSGKDRTGMADDEEKLLYGEVVAEYRLPSFLEQTSWETHIANRKRVTMESGNSLFNTRANLGGVAWWTIGGCRMHFGSGEDAQELHRQYDTAQSASKLFKRPKLHTSYKPASNQKI